MCLLMLTIVMVMEHSSISIGGNHYFDFGNNAVPYLGGGLGMAIFFNSVPRYECYKMANSFKSSLLTSPFDK
jgi:hypothetical protein